MGGGGGRTLVGPLSPPLDLYVWAYSVNRSCALIPVACQRVPVEYTAQAQGECDTKNTKNDTQ